MMPPVMLAVCMARECAAAHRTKKRAGDGERVGAAVNACREEAAGHAARGQERDHVGAADRRSGAMRSVAAAARLTASVPAGYP